MAKGKPRKYAELIKRWADDDQMVIQYRSIPPYIWEDVEYPNWHGDMEYREKPDYESRIRELKELFYQGKGIDFIVYSGCNKILTPDHKWNPEKLSQYKIVPHTFERLKKCYELGYRVECKIEDEWHIVPHKKFIGLLFDSKGQNIPAEEYRTVPQLDPIRKIREAYVDGKQIEEYVDGKWVAVKGNPLFLSQVAEKALSNYKIIKDEYILNTEDLEDAEFYAMKTHEVDYPIIFRNGKIGYMIFGYSFVELIFIKQYFYRHSTFEPNHHSTKPRFRKANSREISILNNNKDLHYERV